MRLSEVAQKLKIPRYKLDYWQETGLLRRSTDLKFKDLLQARFIQQCRQNGVSLQEIRNKIARIAWSDADWHTRLVLQTGGRLLELDPDSQKLLETENGQLHFDYTTSKTGSPVQSLLKSDNSEDAATNPRETYLAELERHYAKALKQGDFKQIKQALGAILREDPDHLAALIELGNIHYEHGRLPEARDYYEQACAIQQDCVEAMYNLANIHFKDKRYAVAIRFFQNCIDLDPEFPEAYYNLGLLYSTLGYIDPAIFCMDRYAELDPDSAWGEQAAQIMEDLRQTKALTDNSGAASLFPVDY